MSTDKLQTIYEQLVLLNEYSEGTLKRETLRLKKQAGAHVSEEMVKETIKRFDQLKSAKESGASIKEKVKSGIENGDIKPSRENDPRETKRIENLKRDPFDIGQYNWNDLTFIVHQFREVESQSTKTASTSTTDGVIYDENNLQIVFAANKTETYNFKKKLYNDNNIDKLRETGVITNIPYGWCIAYEPSRSLFDSYRYGTPPASVYFVIDKDLPATDDRHVIVIHSQSDGKYRVTNAFNNREKVVDWNTVVSNDWQPKLNGLQELLPFVPFTEQEDLYRAVKSVTPNTFRTLRAYKAKEAYINNPGSRLLANDFLNLEPNLQHLYVHVKCAPNITDANISIRVHKVMHPFASTMMSEYDWYQIALSKVIENLTNMSDEEYQSGSKGMEPLYEHPVLSKARPQTHKLWIKIVNDVFDEYVNQNTENKRGYNS
jgi:hypothetical protein